MHVHVVPLATMSDLDFAQADTSPDQADLDALRDQLAAALET